MLIAYTICIALFLTIIVRPLAAKPPGRAAEAFVTSSLAESDSLMRVGALDASRAKAEVAVQLADSLLGNTHTITAEALNALGSVLWNSRDYEQAGRVWQRALSIREQVLPANDPDLAQSLSNVAAVHYLQGRFEQAITFYARALKIYRESLDETHHTIAVVAANLAMLYCDQGRYSLAEPLFKEALSIRQLELGEEHPSVAAGFRDLGTLYFEQGRFAEAKDEFLQALEIQNRIYLPHYADSPEIARTLCALGALYAYTGSDAEAEHTLRRALTIYANSLGDSHPDVAKALIDLVFVCVKTRRFAEADSLMVRAQDIYDKLHRGPNREAAECMENHALLEFAQGKFFGADSLFRSALSVLDSLLPTDHPQVLHCRESYAVFLSLQGNHARANELMSRAFQGFRELLVADGSALPERAALQFAQNLQSATDDYLTVLVNGRDSLDHWDMEFAKTVASSKGLVTSIVSARTHPVIHHMTDQMQGLSDSLRLARYTLAKIRQEDFSTTDGVFLKRMTDAVARKEECETKLAEVSAEYRHSQQQTEASLDSLMSAVPLHSVVIDYFKYQHRTRSDSSEHRYVAVVWRPEVPPEVVELGPADSIESTVAWYRSHLENFASQDPREYDEIANDLFARLWLPLQELVGEAETVFIAPDAELHLVSFAGLKSKNGNFLIEDFAIHYLSSARELQTLRSDGRDSNSGLIAFGDPDFQGTTEASVSGAGAQAGSSLRSSPFSLRSQERSGTSLPSDTNWERLPRSANEVDSIASLWKSLYYENAAVYKGSDATEGRFKAEAGKHRVIHLATHGYFAGTESGGAKRESLIERRLVGENPLLQSGLIFAGANVISSSTENDRAEDGIMTAEEIVSLDLSGTELVLLSACETALGDIKGGDGVFGLRRAFQLAGAKTVVSTLWKIQDQDAADFMPMLLAQGLPLTPKKVQSAVQNHLNELRQQGHSTHPYYWAGFIVAGYWE